MLEINRIYQGDCLEIMGKIDNESINMILCDLPYGKTACKWDIIIPFDPLWKHYKRILKRNGAVVLFGTEPFSSLLRCSNLKNFKYDWVWDKKKPGSCTRAKYGPLKSHEMISVFSFGTHNYYPIMSPRPVIKKRTTFTSSDSCPVKYHDGKNRIYTCWYPKSVLEISNANQRGRFHPTQKPINLCEYLIKTYSRENNLILDNCAGGGTTGVACINTNRNFILIEKEEKYCRITEERIKGAANAKPEGKNKPTEITPPISGRFAKWKANQKRT